MPSDKNSWGLICSLINVASSRDVPFQQPQLLQCLHQGATFVPLWSPILFFTKVTICGRHEMASVRNIKIDEALLMLCLAYYVMKRVHHCRNWDTMAFMYRDMGHTFHEYILRIFTVMAGWIAEILFMLFFACVTNATKLSMKQTGLSVFR